MGGPEPSVDDGGRGGEETFDSPAPPQAPDPAMPETIEPSEPVDDSLQPLPESGGDSDQGGEPLGNRVASPKHGPSTAENKLYRTQLQRTLKEAMATRDPRRTKITRLKYGLEDGVEWTYHELAERFNVTKDVAKHIVRGEVNFLRRSKKRELQEFVGHY